MSLPDLAALSLALGLVLYAAFAGADFGSGIWVALSRGEKGRHLRLPLLQAMQPVWETNHVWLVFAVVTLFTAFPLAFQAVFISLLVPLVLVLVGITLRGAGFAYWHYGHEAELRLPAVVEVFAVASLITPFFMGVTMASLAGGGRLAVRVGESPDLWGAWVSPFTLGAGVIGLAICAYLTPIYMTVRTGGELRDDFRARGMAASVLLGVLTTAQLPLAARWASAFWDRFTEPAPVLVAAAATVFGTAALLALWRRRFFVAQLLAGGTVALTLGGFLAALYPDLVLGRLTIEQAAAPRETLVAYTIALAIGVVVLVPALSLLYWTYRGEPDPALPPGGEA
jgi:cytochrome bd ubiquinol oxidase subunit II